MDATEENWSYWHWMKTSSYMILKTKTWELLQYIPFSREFVYFTDEFADELLTNNGFPAKKQK